MVLTTYAKQRIVCLHNLCYKPPTIKKLLQKEGIVVNRQSVHRFLNVYREQEGLGRPSKLTLVVRGFVEQKMTEDDETTALQLYKHLMDNGILISLTTILRCRTSLGWTFRGSAY